MSTPGDTSIDAEIDVADGFDAVVAARRSEADELYGAIAGQVQGISRRLGGCVGLVAHLLLTRDDGAGLTVDGVSGPQGEDTADARPV